MKQVHGIKRPNVTRRNVPKGEDGKTKVLTKYDENEEGGKQIEMKTNNDTQTSNKAQEKEK